MILDLSKNSDANFLIIILLIIIGMMLSHYWSYDNNFTVIYAYAFAFNLFE